MSEGSGGGESKVVVYAALAGNIAIAIIKGVAFALTRSTAMLSETIHSAVDSLDQILLLVGQARATRAADRAHPFGHGLEMYFWSFTVALMVFLAGGAASVFEGWLKLVRPEPMKSGWVNAAVLALSFVFEGSSLLVGVRQANKVRRGRVGLLAFVKRSKDPNIFVTLLEDSAALMGLLFAAFGVLGATVLKIEWADGAASIAIGLLLMGVAMFLANETRSLIGGEAADPLVVEALRGVLAHEKAIVKLQEIATLQLGPETILVAVTADFADDAPIERVAAHLTEALQKADGRVGRVYFRPLTADSVATAQGPAA